MPRWAAATRFGTTMRPGLLDDLAHLDVVDRCEAHDDPVEAHVRLARHAELVGIGRDQAGPLVPREREAHLALVAGEGEIHDLPHPELHPVVDEDLVAAGELPGDRSHGVDRGHVALTPARSG